MGRWESGSGEGWSGTARGNDNLQARSGLELLHVTNVMAWTSVTQFCV